MPNTHRAPAAPRVHPAGRARQRGARHLEHLEQRALLAAGFLDPAFDGDGRFVRAAGTGGAVVVQPDGRIVTAGAVDSTTGGGSDFLVCRYNPDGSPDATFGQGGSVRTDFAGRSDLARAVALQADGRIVVAGSSGREFALARYHPNGTPDAGFDGDGMLTTAFGFSGAALDVAIQPDGKIVAAGSASPAPGEATFALARYQENGSLDTTFDGDGRVTTASGLTAAYAVAIGSGGKIIAGGSADTNFGDAALARYNPDGSLDTSFGPNPSAGDDVPPAGVVLAAFEGFDVYDEIRDVAVDADGTVVAAGTVEGRGMTLYRFAADGKVAARFESAEFPGGPGGGASFGSAGMAVALRPEGVLAAGHTADAGGQPENFALVRFNPDGVVDRTFGFRGVAVTDFRLAAASLPGSTDPQDGATGLAVGPGGSIVLAGSTNGRASLARYLGAADAAPPPVRVTAENALALDGTAAGDDVRLYPWADVVPRFAADVNGSLFLAPRGVGRAAVFALGGDDAVRAAYPGFNFPLDVDAGPGNDTLTGGGGADTLRGGDGHDWLEGALGADVFRGGAGNDTADYSSRTSSLDVTLDGAANDGASGEGDNVMGDVETVLGGSGNDRLVGSAANNALYGNGGDDTLDGGRGSDMVFGGAGDDTLLAAEGASGGGGASGSFGRDHYAGGAGFDTLDYSGRAARLDIRLDRYATALGAGRDRDTLRELEGAVGGSGNDRIEGTPFANRLLGGAGNDVLLGGRGNDSLLGGAGDDILTDTSGTNSLDGEAGADTVNGVRETTGPVLLEAEAATRSGVGIGSSNGGYTGTGYADYAAATGAYVEFTFDNTSAAGARTLVFRYANGSSAGRPLELRVNGAVVQSSLSFPPTGAWGTWKTVSVSVQLAAGVNRIRLTSIGFSGGNLDSLTIN